MEFHYLKLQYEICSKHILMSKDAGKGSGGPDSSSFLPVREG